MFQFSCRFAFLSNFRLLSRMPKISNIVKIRPDNFEVYCFKVGTFSVTPCIFYLRTYLLSYLQGSVLVLKYTMLSVVFVVMKNTVLSVVFVMLKSAACICDECVQSLIKEQAVRGQDSSVVQVHVMPQSSCAIPDALYMLDDRTCPLLHRHQLLIHQHQQQQSGSEAASSSTVDIIAGTIPGLYCYSLHFLLSLPPPSDRRHLRCDDCLEDEREDYENCAVLYNCVP